ncbi:cytosine permease [Metabacillus litoralis]|jgi:cytosine permease|uniref:cytosine permease n=1 Tax=Metabacillus litoralis TaxID=152268 RepID=UPI0020414450|nr:cytosine permease [Metabacillus litoralis]MCM3653818.1 cytosine permease [Metabacillus litoralis]
MEHKDKDFALEPIPKDHRRGFLSMFFVMLGFTFFSSSMVAGGTLGQGLGMKEFMTIILIGNLILGVYAALLGFIGAKTGLTTHLLTSYSFGKKGSYLTSFILSAIQVGWFGVGVATFAIMVNKATGISLPLLIIISGILMTSTAYWGMKALTALSIIAVPAIAILGSLSIFKATEDVGGFTALMQLEPTDSLSYTVALSICIGSFIGGATLTADFTRFSKSKKDGFITTFIAYFIGNSLMFTFGMIGTLAMGFADISDVMVAQGLIIPAIIVLGLNIWSTNDNSLYTSGLGFSHITKLPKNKLVLFNGFLGTALSMVVYNNFISWLTILGTTIPSIGAIILVDYFLLRRKSGYQSKNMKNVNMNAVVAWAVGIVAANFIPGIPPVNAILAAVMVYVAATGIEKATSRKSLTNNDVPIQ